MNMDQIAMWVGYGVMVSITAIAIAVVVFLSGLLVVVTGNRTMKTMIKIYGLRTLQAHMRRLEEEGKMKPWNENK